MLLLCYALDGLRKWAVCGSGIFQQDKSECTISSKFQAQTFLWKLKFITTHYWICLSSLDLKVVSKAELPFSPFSRSHNFVFFLTFLFVDVKYHVEENVYPTEIVFCFFRVWFHTSGNSLVCPWTLMIGEGLSYYSTHASDDRWSKVDAILLRVFIQLNL